MKKTIVVLLSVLLLLPALVLPCLAEEEAVLDPEADQTAVVDYDDLPGDLPGDEAEGEPYTDGSFKLDLSEDDIDTPPEGVITYGAATGALDLPHVVDEADLFTVDEELALSEKIAQIGAEFSFDVVIVTVTDLLGKSAMAFADDYYDYNGYGYGENHDGVLLLIHMDEDRGYWISTTGLGIKAFTDSELDSIGDDIVPKLSAGNYAGACDLFLDDVYEQVNIEINGRGFQPKLLVIGAVIGLVIALIVIAILKAQLKSVKSKPSASDYYIDGSLAVTGAYDVLVGHHVTRTKRQSESSSSGGSSTHTGSSGTSHGGGGGRF